LTTQQAIAFFATPHFGSNLAAMGWKLRALPGARPAPSLARLAPGPHLYELNELFKVRVLLPGAVLYLVDLSIRVSFKAASSVPLC
jgi:hypothetical protein